MIFNKMINKIKMKNNVLLIQKIMKILNISKNIHYKI